MLLVCDDRFHRAVRRDPVGGADGTVVVERRVVLLSRDAGLASTVGRLLSNGDHIAHFRSAAELADWSTQEVAAVVLDSQPNARRLGYKQVRERYDGPLVMLLDKGERPPDLPPDGARRFLHRPFQVAELSSLLATPTARAGVARGRDHRAWSRHATAEPAAAATPRPLLPGRQPKPVPAAPGPRLGGDDRRPHGPAAGLQPQRPGRVVRLRVHHLRRRHRRGRRERDRAVPTPGRRLGRRRQRRRPAARLVGRLVPAPDPHRRASFRWSPGSAA
jgi:hypothetical protein